MGALRAEHGDDLPKIGAAVAGRKALQAEQGKADMEARIKQLEAEKKDLERQVQELKAKAEAIEKRESERRALEEKKHAEEVQFLKRTNAQLKKELETYLSPTRK